MKVERWIIELREVDKVFVAGASIFRFGVKASRERCF